nr:Mor transcription activator family protein [Nevskia ramosa]
MIDILGRDLAEQLVKAFADDVVISLPKADKLLAQVRDAAIRLEHATGDSMAVLALRYDLTERHVLNIVQSSVRPVWRAPDRDLFGDVA